MSISPRRNSYAVVSALDRSREAALPCAYEYRFTPQALPRRHCDGDDADAPLLLGPNQPDGTGTVMNAWEILDAISERKKRGESYYGYSEQVCGIVA